MRVHALLLTPGGPCSAWLLVRREYRYSCAFIRNSSEQTIRTPEADKAASEDATESNTNTAQETRNRGANDSNVGRSIPEPAVERHDDG